MTDDERTEYGPRRPGVFDDDRLLACALGLDDDPELLAAAAADAGLASRLAAMRRDVGAVGAQVAAAVPAPDASYADLGAARWDGLRPYLQPRPVRSRASRWLRVAVPVAAVLVVALAAGLAIVANRGGSDSTAGYGDSAPTEALTTDKAGVSATPVTAGAPASFSRQLNDFAIVVLAKARKAHGEVQRFNVVRLLKGRLPRVFSLNVDSRPADLGHLHLLLLNPMDELVKGRSVDSMATSEDMPGGPGETLHVAYSYGGEPAVARELPPGTDPQSVSLP